MWRSVKSGGSFIEQIMQLLSGQGEMPGSIAEVFMRGFYKCSIVSDYGSDALTCVQGI